MQWREAFRRRLSRRPGGEPPASWSETATVQTGAAAVDRVEHAAGSAQAPDLPAALGLALTGRRVSVSLGDVPGAADTLAEAVRRHVPLLVHLQGTHVDRTLHSLTDTGALLLFARSAQEAVDLTLVGRRVAERALVPAVVAMDPSATAQSFQDVRVPDEDGVQEFLGRSDDLIESPTPAQEMLFGKSRRRVPRWFDPAHPALHGATLDAVAETAAEAARDPFFLDAVTEILASELAALAAHTGRALTPVSGLFVDDAELVLVAQGALIENAEAVARELRASEKLRIGVVGVRCTHPFPAPAIAERLRARPVVAVLDRTDLPYGDDPPLMRQVRAALGAADGRGPRLVSLITGGGGLPVRAVDLAEFCRAPGTSDRKVLGVDFLPPATVDPKRQVLLDRLRRSYPDTALRGLRSEKPFVARASDRGFVVATHVPAGGAGWTGWTRDAATLVHRGTSLPVRTEKSGPRIERLFVGANTPAAGADVGADVVVAHLGDADLVTGDSPHPLQAALADLAPGGTLVVVGPRDVERVIARMPYSLQRIVRRDSLRIATLRVGGVRDAAEGRERLLGALAGVLAERMSGANDTRLETARKDTLAGLPQEEIDSHLVAFRFGRDHLARLDVNDVFEPTITPIAPPEPEMPLTARHLARTDERWDSLPRFWDQIGVLYREGRANQISPDPYLALRAMPPLSSTFRKRPGEYESLPEFDPALCTGCGDCWTGCPDGAITSRVLGARALLDQGLAVATERGANVAVLRSIVSKLAPAIEQAFQVDTPPRTFAEAARAAFEELTRQTKPAEDRRRSLAEALDALLDGPGALPLARTEAFGTELLTLAIDPHACQGCSACVSVCAPSALRAEPITTVRADRALSTSRLVAGLPDVTPETLARAAERPDVGPAAATMLSVRYRGSFVGGSGATPGSGAQLALRLVLSAVESGRATARDGHLAELQALQARFAQSIRDGLLHSVPTDDLDAISDGLKVLGRRDVEVAQLVERLEDACGSERVDGARLGRLVDAANEVANVIHRIERSRQGAYGTVLSGSELAAWAAAFPHNAFAGPVIVDTADDGLRLAYGLAQAAGRDTVEAVRVRRHAEHVLAHTHPGVPVELPETWEQLSEAERRLCPPLLVVMDASSWGRARFAEAARLLDGTLPVLITVLSGTATEAVATARLAGGRPAAWQSTVAHPDHLVTGVAEAARAGLPAWIHVLGPDPRRAGLASDGARTEAARCVDAGELVLGTVLFGTASVPAAGAAPTDPGASEDRVAAAAAEAAATAEGATRSEMAERLARQLATLAGYGE